MRGMRRELKVRINSTGRLIDQFDIAGEFHRAVETAVELRGDFVFFSPLAKISGANTSESSSGR